MDTRDRDTTVVMYSTRTRISSSNDEEFNFSQLETTEMIRVQEVYDNPGDEFKRNTDVKLRVINIFRNYCGVGNWGNFITLIIMIIGIVLVEVFKKKHSDEAYFKIFRIIRAIGIFGFSGGITNWLAVKMLFDRIPGLIGSGVIRNHFIEIRNTVKEIVLDTFFEPNCMSEYLSSKKDDWIQKMKLSDMIEETLKSTASDEIIDKQLALLMSRQEGLMLTFMGLNADTLKPMIQPFVHGLGPTVSSVLTNTVKSSDLINVEVVHHQVDQLLSARLEEMTASRVKMLVENMIRKHLGWLIVWGNVFGGLIGLICELPSIFTT